MIKKILEGSVLSWRKKAFDIGDRESRRSLGSCMSSSLFSQAVVVRLANYFITSSITKLIHSNVVEIDF